MEELRALDALVAEKVMGWSEIVDGWGLRPIEQRQHGRESIKERVPLYSLNIASAMEVVERMRKQGWSFACTLYEGKLPYASFCRGTAASSKNAEADSLPEAICRAALAAIEV
jgi:hypothetical protein